LGVPPAYAMDLGNASDELLQIMTTTLSRPGAAMLAVEPSFVMYKTNAMLAQMRYVGVPLQNDFTLDTGAVLAAITREQPSLIFLAYPNNPTGNLFPLADIDRIVDAGDGARAVAACRCARRPGVAVARRSRYAARRAARAPAHHHVSQRRELRADPRARCE